MAAAADPGGPAMPTPTATRPAVNSDRSDIGLLRSRPGTAATAHGIAFRRNRVRNPGILPARIVVPPARSARSRHDPPRRRHGPRPIADPAARLAGHVLAACRCTVPPDPAHPRHPPHPPPPPGPNHP